MKIWNGVSKQNQDKMRKMKVTQLAKTAYKLAGMKEEVDLDEGTKQVLAHGGKGKYKVTKDGDKIEIKFGGKVVGTADFDRGADSFFVSIKGERGQKSFDDAQAIADYFAKNKITEEVDLDEGKMNNATMQANKPRIEKAKKLMGPSTSRKEGIQMVAKGMPTSEKEATKLVDTVIKMMQKNDYVPEEVDLDENLNEIKKHIDDLEFERKRMTTSGQESLDKLIKAKSIKDARKAFDDMYGYEYDRVTSSGQESMVKIGKMLGMKMEEVDLDEDSLDDFQDFARLYGGGDEIYVVTQGKDSNSLKVIGIEKDPNKAKKIRDRAKGARASLWGQMKSSQKVLKLKIGDPVSFEDSKNKLSFIEEVDLDEGKMSQLHQYIKDKKSAEEIAKLMKLDVKTVKSLMSSHHPEDVEEGAAADARRAMRADPDMRQKFSKDVSATDDDVKGASKNIMMQMRKAQSLNGRFDVEFADGKKVKIPAKMAIAVQQKYNSMKRPAEKEKFQAKIGKSYKDMLSALKEELQPKKESILERMNRKLKENKDG